MEKKQAKWLSSSIRYAKKYEPDYEAHAEDIYNDMNKEQQDAGDENKE